MYNSLMTFWVIFRDYLSWHYTRAYSDIFHIWRNLTYFIFHFFSIPILLRTLFSPWKRVVAERETRGFDLKDYLSTKLVNLIMSLVGAVMRLVLIAIGLVCTGVVVVGGLIFFVLWSILPLVVLSLISAGITLIIFK